MLSFRRRRKRIEILEQELRTYQLYIKPLEELVREIRARQHEFDNHMNAILNMHYTIDTYDELIEAQSQYIRDMYKEDSRQLIAILKISDKILAGFLYSKIIAAKPFIKVDVQVKSLDIISSVSEHGLIEIVGTLVDNAFEAATEELCNVSIVLESAGNKLVFQISNETKDLTFEQVSHFFDKGYTTKNVKLSDKFANKHGFGLYNARKISKKYGGDVTVSLEHGEDKQIITFRLEI
ncbi:MAG: GHKL domain-containing protein [Lachnospiraceae bacterium]|nr:GHKL domain-containing protein [Lachnospiraceae bacterium]